MVGWLSGDTPLQGVLGNVSSLLQHERREFFVKDTSKFHAACERGVAFAICPLTTESMFQSTCCSDLLDNMNTHYSEHRFFDHITFSDVLLRFGSHELRCHKIILSSQSEYFRKLFDPLSPFIVSAL